MRTFSGNIGGMGKRVGRRRFIKNGARAVLGAAVAQGAAGRLKAGPEPKRRPNILLLLSDEHTLSHIGGYRHPAVKTPNLDYLAAHGVRFTQSYCTSPLCSPARASIHTGRMPHATRVNNNFTKHMKWSLPNMGDALRKAGYATAWAGKLHLGGGKVGDATPPTPPGLQEPTGMMWSYYPTAPDGIPGFENLNYTGCMEKYAERTPDFNSYNVGLEVDPPVVHEAVKYLKRDHEKPFFLTVSIMNPHDICYWAGKKWDELWPSTPKIPRDARKLPPLPANHGIPENEAEWAAARRERNADKDWPERKWREYLYVYKYLLEDLDKSVDRILKTLRKQGLEKDTVVIYTSDHGEGVAGHKWRNKLGPYEEEIAVPFIVSWKGYTPANKVDETHLVSGLDIFPTVCGYAGARVPGSVEGIDLKQIIENPSRPGRDMLVVELGTINKEPEDPVSGGIGRVIRTRRFKYMRFDTKEEMLFDMEIDPGEMKNLAGEKRCATILKEHRDMLVQYIKNSDDHFKMEGIKRMAAAKEG